MAHNLYDNRMMYYGETPWHGLGTKLDNPATAREAITVAGLDYKVNLEPLFIKNQSQQNQLVQLTENRAAVRSDTADILGVVGKDYKVVQNSDAFQFFDSIVGEGQAIYHTAGALGLGERIWIMAKLPKSILITKDDVIEKYLLLTTSHDGTSSLKMYFTPVRVVCQNTLIASLRGAKDGISIRHTGDVMSKANEARRTLGLAVNYFLRFEEDLHALRRYQMTSQELDAYFDFTLGKVEDKEMSTKMKNDKDVLTNLFERGKGNDMDGLRGSAYSAYNAVTEFADHYKTVRGSNNRLKSIWFGSGADMKIKALQAIKHVVQG